MLPCVECWACGMVGHVKIGFADEPISGISSRAECHDIRDFSREFSPPKTREPSIGHVQHFGIPWGRLDGGIFDTFDNQQSLRSVQILRMVWADSSLDRHQSMAATDWLQLWQRRARLAAKRACRAAALAAWSRFGTSAPCQSTSRLVSGHETRRAEDENCTGPRKTRPASLPLPMCRPCSGTATDV
ncbi:hypothetical protein ETAA8_43830 [Anatilimnocola aggregata]|uniref:Uncharacterized protein n=1 Tax=Anatilimnocola aggregata TaxID=2528021 RepID=A0A517YGC3_9BACT|nr:hypothetical protein ETAA8_43830 [Anatilimnocola aggregata]